MKYSLPGPNVLIDKFRVNKVGPSPKIVVQRQINFNTFCHAGEGRYLPEWIPAFAGMTE